MISLSDNISHQNRNITADVATNCFTRLPRIILSKTTFIKLFAFKEENPIRAVTENPTLHFTIQTKKQRSSHTKEAVCHIDHSQTGFYGKMFYCATFLSNGGCCPRHNGSFATQTILGLVELLLHQATLSFQIYLCFVYKTISQFQTSTSVQTLKCTLWRNFQ